jgi:peptidyl-prolyl cis-trans isomerase SurA
MKQFLTTYHPSSIRLVIISLCVFGINSPFAQATQINHIVAIVEDNVILQSELNNKLELIINKFESSSQTLPPASKLKQQVLERLIIENLQYQLAAKNGLVISEKMINQSIAQIAKQNQLSVPEFRQELANQDMDFIQFQSEIRNQLMIDKLRNREVARRIKVTDQEIDNYLKVRGGSVLTRNHRYQVGHILLALPENPSPTQIQSTQQKAQRLTEKLHDGADFHNLAVLHSTASTAAKGGDLGWRSVKQLPSMFAKIVPTLNKGDIHEPIVNSSGYHIIKLLDLKGDSIKGLKQTQVRHILIKTDQVFGDEPARKKIIALINELENGKDFSILAKAHSDDKVSALSSGNLGWISPGALVPPFEKAMNQLDINTVSEPVKTKYGWHIIEVLGRRESKDSATLEKAAARTEISHSKMEEETRLWLRQLREEAYVEVRI